jgi:hypothetical protein
MRHDQPSSLIRHLQVLRAVNEAVSRSLDLNEVLQRSLAALTHVTGHEISSLHLISADGNSLLLRETEASVTSCAGSMSSCPWVRA